MGGDRAAIEIEGLSRDFEVSGGQSRTALDKVSLQIPKGEVHGLLGPNGAGKTTLIKILTTVLLPTSGRAWVAGCEIVQEANEVRHVIGAVFGGDRGLYGRLSAQHNLEYWGAVYGLSSRQARLRARALLERVGLSERRDQRVEEYSRGMKQRLHLARGLIGRPEVLFLDEPSSGMDPIAARSLRALVTEICADGMTLLVTTHDMSEAETICDAVTLLDRGRVLATATPKALAQATADWHAIDVEDLAPEHTRELRRHPAVSEVNVQGDVHEVRIFLHGPDNAGEVLEWLIARGVTSLRSTSPSLEDVYLHLLGRTGMTI